MSILNQGCTCQKCSENENSILEKARKEWLNGAREILFKPYHHSCGDGCCYEYGTDVFINDFLLTGDGENIESVISSLMEFLSIENVQIDYDYSDDD